MTYRYRDAQATIQKRFAVCMDDVNELGIRLVQSVFRIFDTEGRISRIKTCLVSIR